MLLQKQPDVDHTQHLFWDNNFCFPHCLPLYWLLYHPVSFVIYCDKKQNTKPLPPALRTSFSHAKELTPDLIKIIIPDASPIL